MCIHFEFQINQNKLSFCFACISFLKMFSKVFNVVIEIFYVPSQRKLSYLSHRSLFGKKIRLVLLTNGLNMEKCQKSMF